MLYGIEGILNGKLFGNGEGGSSGGGITLPTLTNPAGADQILEGYEAVDGSGKKLTGTHVCESGEDSNWVNYDKSGEKWIGETVDSDDCFSNTRIVLSPTNQYRVTLDGVSQIVDNLDISNNDVASFNGGEFYGEFGDVCVMFNDGGSHAFKVESWIGEEPYVEGGSGESGGVGVAPQIDHGYGYLTFTTYDDEVVSAGSSQSLIEITGYDQSTIQGSTSGDGYGYIYGHPEITVYKNYSAKYGQCINAVWNSSATDFTFKAGETYTMVFLYHK